MTAKRYQRGANGEIVTREIPAELFMLDAMAGGAASAIERQEADGAQQLREVQMLPKRGTDGKREEWEAVGIKFFEDVDDLFVRVEFPAGWKVESASHDPRHMELQDDAGKVRARIFYKAAFYDRVAHCYLLREGEQ